MRASTCKGCGAAIVWIETPGGKSMPCDATPRYYIEKPRSGSKKIVTPNGEVISCEYTEDPHKATGTGFAPHWGAAGRQATSESEGGGGISVYLHSCIAVRESRKATRPYSGRVHVNGAVGAL